jgi:hypothetical protein
VKQRAPSKHPHSAAAAAPTSRRGPGTKRQGPARARQDVWRLFLNLSLTGFAGGLLLALIGAWLAAALTFAFGLLSALLSGWLLRRAGAKTPRPHVPAVQLRVRKGGRR